MRNIKVSFHHTRHIYKFKLDLHVYENSNMLNIDPRKSLAAFHAIVSKLILTTEEKIIFETLSLAFKDQFLKKYEKALQERKTIDFLGNTVDQQLDYFQKSFQISQGFVTKIKQLYIFLTRDDEEAQKFKQQANKPKIYKLIYKFATQYQSSAEQSKTNSYIFYYCVLTSILRLFRSHGLVESEKQEVIEYVNKNVLLALDKILYQYEYTYLNSFFEQAIQIWKYCLDIEKNNGWLYKKHEDNLLNNSTLRLLTQSIKPENKNFSIQASIIKLLLHVLEKCDGVNQLLLFITECINLRITIRLDQLNEAISMLKFSRQNSIYLNLPKDLTEDFGKKVIRMKQKNTNQQNWNTEINICKLNLKQLIERFVKFKHGKIQAKRPKEIPYKSERQRIRKESFIMTNFQEIKHKYQEAMLHEDHNTQNYKLLTENKQLLQLNKTYQEIIKDKQAIIAELELAVAQFVDVRQKYVRQNILKIQSKVAEHKIEHHGGVHKMEQHLIESKRKSVDKYKQIFQNKTEISSSLILPPPPPPPPFQKPNSLRGSRKSHEVNILPPPPPSLNLGLPQLLLPPPPPIGLPLLSNLPNISNMPTLSNLPNLSSLPVISLSPPSLTKTVNKEKKDVKMINWTTVQISKVKDSFWESVQEVEVNEKQLVSFFAKKQDITAQAPKIVIAPQRQKKSLLRPERAKNIEIILRKTRISIPQIPFAIEQLDEQVLTSINADNLLNALPTGEQTEIFIQLLINEPEEWSDADLYFCLITKIQGYSEILTAIKFKSEFEFIAEKYNEKLNQFEAFFVELEKDSFFQSFLSYLLSVGNFMNSDTSKGNAYGFKLESIEKSYSLMGQDKKTSLFEYIMQMMVKKQVKFPQKSYYRNKRITPIEILKDDLKQLTKECRNVQECLLMSNEDDLRTPEVFLSFYIECRQKVSLMDVKYNDCVKIFNKVCEFYCQKMQSEKIAKIVNELRDRVYKYLQKNKIEIKK